MNWFRQNRFLGLFLVLLGGAILLSFYFLLHEKAVADEAGARLETTITELNRLRGSAPFPSADNLRKMKAQTDSYRDSLLVLETELKSRMFPRSPLQPNEFQALLRQAAISVTDRARASRVQVPENFNLGFDEYATSLPNSVAAPRLRRQLRAIEWLANTVIDAHVDALQNLTRTPLPEERTASTPTPTPGGKGRPPRALKPTDDDLKIVDWTPVDLVFEGSPAAARRVLNQLAAAKEQTYVIRTLQVRNPVDKGPKRGGPEEAPAAPAQRDGTRKAGEPGISFIVGTEHIKVSARIEIVRFNLPEKEIR